MKDATRLLVDVGRGEPAAGEALLGSVYETLRRLAAGYLRRDRAGATLQPTALVHEAYLRLVDDTALSSGDRERFLAIAARAMRQVLVDRARRRKTAKRGGDCWHRITLESVATPAGARSVDLVALDDLINRLSEMAPRAGRVVELRFFGGLTIEEMARILDVSTRTIDNDLYVARAWLARELDCDGAA